MSNPVSQFIPPPHLSPLVIMFVFYTCDSISSFLNRFICTIFLDSTYKLYHLIFFFLCLTYFTQYDNL